MLEIHFLHLSAGLTFVASSRRAKDVDMGSDSTKRTGDVLVRSASEHSTLKLRTNTHEDKGFRIKHDAQPRGVYRGVYR